MVALVVAVVVVVMVGVLEVDVAVVVALAGTVRKYSENALYGNARERSDMFGKVRKKKVRTSSKTIRTIIRIYIIPGG